MLIPGYGDGPLAAGEPLLEGGGFWWCHLVGPAEPGPGEGWLEPERFGADGADADAMTERLYDGGAWPVFRVPFDGGRVAAVVYRNLEGDGGVEFLLALPGRSRPEVLADFDGDWRGAGVTWPELVRIADAPDQEADGVHDPAERLLLMPPALDGSEPPAGAVERVAKALVVAGAPEDSARGTAVRLLEGHRRWAGYLSVGDSPLSG
ncbi:hypothetical protein [Kitasatospora sp. NPDC017646]|uniref:hypothetical protein n=1 Tax=Kitasatospora sp. NPDC017646 TaxID=3364024 RepID=UPI0037A0803D